MTKISLDEIMEKRGAVDGVMYRAVKMPKSFDKETRSATFVMTDETTDSYGDIVRAKGADLTRFMSNPIALLNHNASMPVGTWDDVKRIVRRIEGTVTLAEEGTAPHIDMTNKLMAQGILRAASIGFLAKDYEAMTDDDGRFSGIDFKAWEMTECSVVSVPANPSALAKSIKQGNPMALEFIEQVLDTYTKTTTGMIVAKADLEAIRKEGLGKGANVAVRVTDENEEDIEVLIPKAAEPTDEEIEAAVEKNMEEIDTGDLVLELGVDASEAHKELSLISKMVDAISEKLFRSKEVEPEAPVLVEGSVDRAKALRERIQKLAA